MVRCRLQHNGKPTQGRLGLHLSKVRSVLELGRAEVIVPECPFRSLDFRPSGWFSGR